MLSREQLLALIADHESDRVEVTTATANTDKFGEAVCAFANDFPRHGLPGYLLVGVRDDGALDGLTVDDALLRRFADLRSNVNLEPLPAITVEKHALPGGDVAVIEVAPSDLPPVRYKGRVWIRIDPSRRGATQQEERLLVERRTAGQRPFDVRPCIGSSLDDLAIGIFLNDYLPQAVAHDVIEENRREIADQLASLRLFDIEAGCPTHAGILLFGSDPLRWLPGAWLQFVRYAGDSVAADVLEEENLSGDLVSTLAGMDRLLTAQLQSRPVADSVLRERSESDYPKVAVRELLLNAVMHRSYENNAPVRFSWFEDRLEIQSPGGLYGLASPDNFPSQTDYRNPVVSEAMANLGYVNRFGRGVVRAQDALESNGNPPAKFRLTDPASVLVTLRGKA